MAQDISPEEWAAWPLSCAPALCKSYLGLGIRHMLWNADFGQMQKFGGLPQCGSSFYKVGMVSHGLQVSSVLSPCM